ncbi:transaldolase family protein [Lancefieldella parvula]|jgi:transaldolase|uniref:transaldolase family protein n=1 Tax=Lancefieldella parvula TaxID=1382 RepID=UPI0028D5596F|nr:transaldolase family protein [Lancefieldella parvula]
MEFILDTADLEAVKQLDELLTIEGVTTNPSIITKSGKTPEQVIKEFVEYLRPEQKFFVQVVSTDYEQMLEEARYICSLRPKNTYVKIPVTHNGYKAIKQLKSEGLGVLATAIYSADEAFLAAMNGADYLAPYVNRMCNYGDGIGQVLDLLQMLETQGFENTKVIAASFKNVEQVHALIAAGIQSVTVPPEVVFTMIDHPGTKIAVDEFSVAWREAYGRNTLLG